jgi:hypothetical protein
MLLWGGILIFAMLLLVVIQKAIRYVSQSRVRSIHREFGMRKEDLDRMTRTGLLSEEERKKIQQAIVRSLSEESREAISRQLEDKLALQGLPPPNASTGDPPAGPGEKAAPDPPAPPGSPPPPAPRHPLPTPRAPSPGRPARRPTIDLEALLEKGLITPEEYEQLKKKTQ